MKNLSAHLNWKIILMRILINGVTLALTILIVPGVYAVDPSLLGFLVLGIVFGVLNAVIKPFVQIFTLPFLFVSYGLVVIIINSVVLFVLARIADKFIVMESLISLIVAALIVGIVGGFLESIFGVAPPIIDMQNPAVEE